MKSNSNTIFVGIKISERLRDQLDSSNASMQPFFAGNNPEYLQVLQIDNEEHIGKNIESGTSLEVLGNVRMNVITMLKMICPKFTLVDDAIKVHALAQINTVERLSLY